MTGVQSVSWTSVSHQVVGRMPRFRRALRILCCFSAAKDEFVDSTDAELEERLRLYRAAWRQRQTEKLWRKRDSNGITENVLSEICGKNVPKKSSRQRRMEADRATQATMQADKEAGGEIMERGGMMDEGKAESEARTLLEKKREEEEREARILAIRRRTVTRRYEAEKVRGQSIEASL